MSPRAAFVLAAGLGQRLRPLTLRTPKPLIKVSGRPLILHLLDQLCEVGVERFVINTHLFPEQFVNLFPTRNWRGRPIDLVHEIDLLETGGGLANVVPRLPAGEPILLIASDILTTASFAGLIEAHRTYGRPASTLLTRTLGPPHTLEISEQGTVLDLRQRLNRRGIKSLGYTGIAILELEKLSPFLPPPEPESIVETWIRALDAVEEIYSHQDDDSIWIDIGDLDRLEHARRVWPLHTDPAIHRKALRIASDLPLRLSPIPSGASDRSFVRITSPVCSKRAIACAYATATRPEYAHYGKLARELAALGFPVPEVLAEDRTAQMLWLEDCGDRTLLEIAQSIKVSPTKLGAGDICPLREALDLALESLRQLHHLPTSTSLTIAGLFEPSYFIWEQDLFLDYCASPLLNEPPDQLREILAEPFLFLRKYLTQIRPAYLHRDFQSQNLLLHNGRIRWIDFQSMRLGPPAYDVASLCFDPYLDLDSSTIQSLLRDDAISRGLDPSFWADQAAIAATQRLLQALGAFGLHGLRKNNPFYLRVIPIALNLLLREMPHPLREGPLYPLLQQMQDVFLHQYKV
ncbi:MAG: phosphotransferase [Puniceicoccaceae bacterium]